MIVLFAGGPYDGEYRDFPPTQKEIRVGLVDAPVSTAAFYTVGDSTTLSSGKKLAVARFTGIRDSAESLMDLQAQEVEDGTGLTESW